MHMDSPTRTLALIQMEIGPDSERNLNKALGRTKRALQDGAKIVCLPELFRSRYFPQQIGKPDPASAETIPGESTDAFALLAREYEAVIIVPVFEKGDDGKFRNAAVIIDADGSIHAPYYKIHIPEDPGFFEKCYFYPGDHYAVHTTRYGRIAVLICYDQWFPEAARSVALDGADIIFYPTAIGNLCENPPGEGDWQEAWELIQRSHAIANSVHVAAVNRVGREGNIRFFGGSFVCDAFGKILGHAGDGEETVMATIDISMNAAIRDSWGFFRNRRPDTYTSVCSRVPEHDATAPIPRKGDTPRKLGYFMPAEWEPHDAVWLSWPHNKNTFPHLKEVGEGYVRFITAITLSEHVELFVPNPMVNRMVKSRLRAAEVDLSRVTIRTISYSDVWIRDYGPTFITNPALNKAAMVRWKFNAWGEKYDDQIADGRVPEDINRWLDLPVFSPGIILEGGSIDTNGRGTILTTRSCLLNKNRNPSLSIEEIEEYLKEYLGATKIVWLNRGIVGDDTDGHVDDVARFVSPTTVVCAYEENPKDGNYAALHENYEILSKATDQENNPFILVKLPMPAPVVFDGERYPASYTNFYIGNTVVVVPVFDDPNDEKALAILRELFPGREVVGVNARAMVEGSGTFHCATQQQPRP
ncbi:MAG: agmatine deiminase family protein [Methanoregula sp.]|nr:agmatine deiminase family protein [Methanoregula sp.]